MPNAKTNRTIRTRQRQKSQFTLNEEVNNLPVRTSDIAASSVQYYKGKPETLSLSYFSKLFILPLFCFLLFINQGFDFDNTPFIMERTPVKVYEDREVLKTPHSGIKRVLNITPANHPLSPKDVNVQTPLIFKPKKLQIPDIFSPISKIKSLQTRAKYTFGNSENCENFETEDETTCNDAITSTPIVPKRNRNYYNCLKITPKPDKSNVKIFEKKGSVNKFHNNIKYSGRKINTNNNDIYNLRRKNLKENLTNELKAVLHKKQMRNETDKKTIENLLHNNKERGSKGEKGTSVSFEELKARFERVKSKSASTNLPLDRHTKQRTDSFTRGDAMNEQKDTKKKTSPFNSRELLMKQAGEKINLMSSGDFKVGYVKTNKSIAFESSGISVLEGSIEETRSNLNYYTAFPDHTHLMVSSIRAVPSVSIEENIDYGGQKQIDHNDISGVQAIPKSLNVSSMDNNSVQKSFQNINTGSNRKSPPLKPSAKEKNLSKIPKFNMEKSNKLGSSSSLISDNDIDRITHKMNLGPTRTFNSTSNEKETLRGRNPAKLLSQPKQYIQQNKRDGTIEHCKHDPNLKLAFQSPLGIKRKRLIESKDDALRDNLCTLASCKKVQIESKTKSEPKRKSSSFKISRQNKTENETFEGSTLSRGVSLSYNSRKRKMSLINKNTHSGVQNSETKLTSQYKISRCDGKISLRETVSTSKDHSTQKQSSRNVSHIIKQTSEIYSSQNESSRDHRDNTSQDLGSVNSTFVIQSSNSRYCYCSIPRGNASCPHSILSSCSSKYVCETRSKSVKSSLETLGECFKFRRKSTMYSSETKNLKRSYSFVHVSFKDRKKEARSLLDLYSLSQSFPKNSYHFPDTESSPILPHDHFPKHSHKKRKQLKNLTTDHFNRNNKNEERRETLKESEEIYDEIDKKDISNDIDHLPKTDQPNKELQFHTYKQNYGQPDSIELCLEKFDPPHEYNTANQTEPSQLKKTEETYHRQNIISNDIEKDSLSDESDDCVVLNEEFSNKTHKIINNEKELMEISKGVDKVENELSDLSKLHAEIKENLVIKWSCPTPLKSSSSSDNISEGNESVKDDGDVDNRSPLRNAASGDQIVNTNRTKSQLCVLAQNVPWSLKLDKQQNGDHYPPEISSLSSEPLSIPSATQSKPSRGSSPLKLQRDQQKRDEYKIFLEEQNYRAIQMIESRLCRVEEKLGNLQSITLDIRNLLQAKVNSPAGDGKSIPNQESARPPPPPPPPPPPSAEMFFFPLRSSTSHNSTLAAQRRRSSPRAKSLRPAITVDDLRSVTLRKVSKEQMQAELTVRYPKQTAM